MNVIKNILYKYLAFCDTDYQVSRAMYNSIKKICSKLKRLQVIKYTYMFLYN